MSLETVAVGRKGELNPAAAIILLTFVTVSLLLPFLDKPFHIDDTLFVWTARQIQKNPSDFYGFMLNWDGPREPMHVVTQNPPLHAYVLAGAAWIGGWSERWLHTACLLPAVGTVLGTWCLARRLCNRPVLAALAVATSPVFLISSTNVMCDVLMTCFWVWAVVLWLEGLERDSHVRLAAAALLIGLAALTKYFGICLLPLFAVYTIVRKRTFYPGLLWLLIPVATLVGYEFLTRHLYGHGLLTGASAFARTNYLGNDQNWSGKLVATFTFAGGCLVALLLFLPRLFPSRMILLAMALLTVGVAVVLQRLSLQCLMPSNSRPTSWDLSSQAAILIVLGLCIAVLPLLDLRQAWLHRSAETDSSTGHEKLAISLLLGCWVLGTMVFAGFINWSVNGRSVLPLVPAAAILMCRRWEITWPQSVSTLKQCWPLLLAAVPALAATHADYRMAWNSRDAATALAQHAQDTKTPLWFFGHWGFLVKGLS